MTTVAPARAGASIPRRSRSSATRSARVADEMALIIARTAYSATVRDALDYSTALLNPRGELIAQGLGIALHLGSFPSAVGEILRAYRERMQPGDVYILNDPYGWGGIHLPDIYLVKPVFHEGRLVAVAACLAHHTDVGGLIPRQQLDDDDRDLPGRDPDPGRPTLRGGPGQPGAARHHRRERARAAHGPRRPARADGRRSTRGSAGISTSCAATAPSGWPSLEDALLTLDRADGAPRDRRRSRTACTGRRRGSTTTASTPTRSGSRSRSRSRATSITVDFAGTLAAGPRRDQLAVAVLEVRGLRGDAARARPRDPELGGYFRPITSCGDEGTVVHPRLPGGLRRARHHRVPDHGRRVRGAGSGRARSRPGRRRGRQHDHLARRRRRRGEAVHLRRHVLGGPRRAPRRRRAVGRAAPGSNNANMPVEIAESTYPLRFHRTRWSRTGVAGRWRGSPSLVRDFTYLGRPTAVQVRSDKRDHPPFGLAGGATGRPVDDSRRFRRRGHRAAGHRALAAADRRPIRARAGERRAAGAIRSPGIRGRVADVRTGWSRPARAGPTTAWWSGPTRRSTRRRPRRSGRAGRRDDRAGGRRRRDLRAGDGARGREARAAGHAVDGRGSRPAMPLEQPVAQDQVDLPRPEYSRLGVAAIEAWVRPGTEAEEELLIRLGNLVVSTGADDRRLEEQARNSEAVRRRVERSTARAAGRFPQFRARRSANLEPGGGVRRARGWSWRPCGGWRRGSRSSRASSSVSTGRARAGCAPGRWPGDAGTGGRRRGRLVRGPGPGASPADRPRTRGRRPRPGLRRPSPRAPCRRSRSSASTSMASRAGERDRRSSAGTTAREAVAGPSSIVPRPLRHYGEAISGSSTTTSACGRDPFRRGASCLYDVSPASDFLVDEVPGSPGLFVVTGAPGHGFGSARSSGGSLLDRLDGVGLTRAVVAATVQLVGGARGARARNARRRRSEPEATEGAWPRSPRSARPSSSSRTDELDVRAGRRGRWRTGVGEATLDGHEDQVLAEVARRDAPNRSGNGRRRCRPSTRPQPGGVRRARPCGGDQRDRTGALGPARPAAGRAGLRAARRRERDPSVRAYANVNRSLLRTARPRRSRRRPVRRSPPASMPSRAPRSTACAGTREDRRGGALIAAGLERLARGARGDRAEVDLLVECHGRFNARTAAVVMPRLAASTATGSRRPSRSGTSRAGGGVRDATDARLAGGEMLVGVGRAPPVHRGERRRRDHGDVKYCGGIAALRDVAALADAYGIELAPHNPSGPGLDGRDRARRGCAAARHPDHGVRLGRGRLAPVTGRRCRGGRRRAGGVPTGPAWAWLDGAVARPHPYRETPVAPDLWERERRSLCVAGIRDQFAVQGLH